MRFTDREIPLAENQSVRVRFPTPQETDDPLVKAVASGVWQPTDALRWLLLNIREGDRVLDLGAHVGTFSLLAAALGAHVTAVEASLGNVDLLRAGTDENDFSGRMTIIQAAVTSEMGPVTFAEQGPYGTIDTEHTGRASGWPVVTVRGVTIDSLSATPYELIKIDIEGAECAAIAGGTRTLSSARGLAVESNGYMLGEHGTSTRDLLDALAKLGLRCYSTSEHTLSPVGRGAFQPETNVDYVVVADGEAPYMPPGWRLGRRRTRRELLGVLVSELHHPVAEHRACALGVARRAPAWARWSPSLRHAVRELDTDMNPFIVRARVASG
jgi:FkbM family methyltransferase